MWFRKSEIQISSFSSCLWTEQVPNPYFTEEIIPLPDRLFLIVSSPNKQHHVYRLWTSTSEFYPKKPGTTKAQTGPQVPVESQLSLEDKLSVTRTQMWAALWKLHLRSRILRCFPNGIGGESEGAGRSSLDPLRLGWQRRGTPSCWGARCCCSLLRGQTSSLLSLISSLALDAFCLFLHVIIVLPSASAGNSRWGNPRASHSQCALPPIPLLKFKAQIS